MVTRADIRKAMLDQDVWHNVGYGVITSAGLDSITDTANLGYGGLSANQYANRRIYLPGLPLAADQVRLVKEFKSEQRRLLHAGPNYSGVPTGQVAYEIHQVDPVLINRAMARALTRRCFSVQRNDIQCDGNTLYTIGTAPFDVLSFGESPDEQILDVEFLSGTDPTAVVKPWDRDGRVYWGELDANVLAVRFDPAPTGVLRVIWKKPYAALYAVAVPGDPEPETECPLPYAMWATLYELYASLEERAINQHESADEYRRLKLDFEARMIREQRIAMGRYAGRIRRTRRSRTRRHGPMHTLAL